MEFLPARDPLEQIQKPQWTTYAKPFIPFPPQDEKIGVSVYRYAVRLGHRRKKAEWHQQGSRSIYRSGAAIGQPEQHRVRNREYRHQWMNDRNEDRPESRALSLFLQHIDNYK